MVGHFHCRLNSGLGACGRLKYCVGNATAKAKIGSSAAELFLGNLSRFPLKSLSISKQLPTWILWTFYLTHDVLQKLPPAAPCSKQSQVYVDPQLQTCFQVPMRCDSVRSPRPSTCDAPVNVRKIGNMTFKVMVKGSLGKGSTDHLQPTEIKHTNSDPTPPISPVTSS